MNPQLKRPGEPRETALLLGRNRNLVSVLTQPSSLVAELPAVVLLNAGSIHRVGPNRVYVAAARRLARAGRLVCRFDFTGLGDSIAGAEEVTSAGGFEERAANEAGEVMDELGRRFGVERFVLVGMCSGADIAFRRACRDPRVVGLVLVNGHLVPDTVLRAAFPRAKLRSVLRRYRRNLASVASWRRLLTGQSIGWSLLGDRLTRWRSRKSGSSAVRIERQKITAMDAAACTAGFYELAARSVRLSLVYSDGSLAFDLFRTTLRDALRPLVRQGRIELQLVRRTDHVFSSLDSQQRLLGLISSNWVLEAGSR